MYISIYSLIIISMHITLYNPYINILLNSKNVSIFYIKSENMMVSLEVHSYVGMTGLYLVQQSHI